MKTRLISALVVLPVALAVIVLGGLPIYAAAVFIALVGIYEIYKAFGVLSKTIYAFNAVLAFAYLVFLYLDRQALLSVLYAVFFIGLLFMYVLTYPKYNIKDIAGMLFGTIYIVYLLTFIIMVRDEPDIGIWMVWFIFAIAIGSDTGAYLVGTRFGKRKLVPLLSPNKTVEGAFGGLLGSVVLCILVGLGIVLLFEDVHIDAIPVFAVMGLFGSVVSQLGDLVASGMKRQTGIKDFGKIMPGHGGVVDRMDSFLVVAPYVYFIMKLWF